MPSFLNHKSSKRHGIPYQGAKLAKKIEKSDISLYLFIFIMFRFRIFMMFPSPKFPGTFHQTSNFQLLTYFSSCLILLLIF